MKTKNIFLIILATALILLVLFLAMQLTHEVNWSLMDFVIIGALLLAAGFTYELITSKMKSSVHKAVVGIVLLVTVILVWIELAVGIFGAPFSGS